MSNREVFKQIFGIYATELWAMSESDFLEWLNAKHIATESRPKDAWIPCSRELPNKEGKYIVFGYWEGKEEVTVCGFYTELGRFGASWHFDIIAWMPLPEPYRGDSE